MMFLKKGANGVEWSNLIRKSKPKKLECMVEQVIEECGSVIGKMFDLDDLKQMQKNEVSGLRISSHLYWKRLRTDCSDTGEENYQNEGRIFTTRQQQFRSHHLDVWVPYDLSLFDLLR